MRRRNRYNREGEGGGTENGRVEEEEGKGVARGGR